MRIEVLYFDGCPGHERLMPRLGELLTATGVENAIELVAVESLEDAERRRFLGSPTLRIDGVDVDPTAVGRSDYGLKCRLYRINGAHQTLPADEWILAALKQARASEGTNRDRVLDGLARPRPGTANLAARWPEC